MNNHQNKSILEKLNLDRCACRMHAGCMQPVKIKLLRTAFDWSYQVFLNHLPISACFFTFFILLPLTPCAISYSYFFLHQKLLYPQIGKFKSLLYHVKNLHVDLSKFWVKETQKDSGNPKRPVNIENKSIVLRKRQKRRFRRDGPHQGRRQGPHSGGVRSVLPIEVPRGQKGKPEGR